MIKRTIEISREPMHLSVHLDQLRLNRHTEDESAPLAASIPCEDIGVVVVDHGQTTYSHHALARLVEFGAAVVVCGRNHMPAGMLLPLSSNTEVVWRLQEQVAAPRTLRKKLWQQIVVAKVRAQAANLAEGSAARTRLNTLTRAVRSDDASNVEAQAAKVYWSVWIDAFRRDTDGGDPINAMLNYGYAVVRAAVARALVSAGLHPALGIHHSNRSNAFCLADDVMEPLRPIVDARVRKLHRRKRTELDQSTKANLLELLTTTVRMGGGEGESGPLMVCLHDVAASLVRCYRGEHDELRIPVVAEVEA